MEEMNIEPKRFNKKKVLPVALLGLLVMGLVSAAGYGLFTARSHFEVVEGIEVEYYTGTTWLPLDVSGGQFDLGTATIKPGETDSFKVRSRNTASSGAVGLVLEIEDVDGLSYDIRCVAENSSGLRYTKGTNIFYFKSVANAGWKELIVDTTAEGNLPIGTEIISFNNVLTRDNILSGYATGCP